MAIKYKYPTKTEVPTEFQTLYVERDGAWLLDVEGAVDKGRLEDARSNNSQLINELNSHKKRFEGIDPEEVRKLATEKRRLEEESQLKAGEVEKVFANRLQSAKADWDKQLGAVAAERDALNARLAAIQIDQAVVNEASKRGLRGTAAADVMARARNVFRLVNGCPTPFEANGQTVRAGKDGVSPMNLAEWVDSLVADAPHLFEANVGGGAVASGGNVGSRTNPFRRESWNVTEQMVLMRTDPQLAERLRAAA